MEIAVSQDEIEQFTPPEDWRGELKALLRLGAPMALTQLAHFAVYTIDVLMIGRISPDHLAAASLGTILFFLMWMIGFGPVMAVTPLVSQALGANKNDRKDARRSVRMSLWLLVFMFPLIVLISFCAEPILLFFGQDPGVSKLAADYMLMLSFGWPFALGVMALRNFLGAIEKTTVPLLLVIFTTLINACLNYLLIFGHFGFPKMDLVGAGIASSISYAISFGIFAFYVYTDKDAKPFMILRNVFTPDWARMKDVVLIGLPISITTLFEGMMFNAAALIMGTIGVNEMAAWQVGINVAALAFMIPWGMSMAGATRIGLAAGAGHPRAVRRVALLTLLVCIIGIGVSAIPVALIPRAIAMAYLDISDPANVELVRLVAIFLPIAAGFMLFDATQVAANQLLRGLKDVRWPMVLTGVSYWLIGFPLAYYLAKITPIGASGVWWGLMAGLAVASITLGARLWWVLRIQMKMAD